MDKRYFLIIIIIFVCCINLYMIVNVSDVVGSASADMGNYTFSLPVGFTLYETTEKYVVISDLNTKIDIQLFHVLGKKDTFLNKYNLIRNDTTNYKIYSNGTLSYNGIVINAIFYHNINTSQDCAQFYFTKFGHNFRIMVVGFDYNSDKNETIDMICKIIESIKINYKIKK